MNAAQGRRVLDEAVRLVDVLQAARPAPGGSAPGESAAHEGPDCRACPLCRGLAAVRGADPVAVERVTTAATALVAALRDLVAGPPPQQDGRHEDGPHEDGPHEDGRHEDGPERGPDEYRPGDGSGDTVAVQRIEVTD